MQPAFPVRFWSGILICLETSTVQNDRESSTPAVIESSSTETLSSQTDESITSRYQTSMDDSESSSTLSKIDEVFTTIHSELLSSISEQQETSEAGEQCT